MRMPQNMPVSALIGLILTGTFLFVAIFAQWIAPYDISDVSGGQWEGSSVGGEKPR